MKWRRNGKLIEKELIEYLEDIFKEEIERGHDLKVCIGSDSQKAGRGYKFATAIVIETSETLGHDLNEVTGEKIPVVVGRGGIVMGTTFWEEMKASTNKKKHREIEILNARMLKEVSASINVGYEIWPLLDLYGIPLEIHADVNPDPRHESHAAMSETLGYIRGMGWDAKIKPDAYAASTGADKMC